VSLARKRHRLPSLLHWLLSLARQRPPLPAVVVTAAATDGSRRAQQIIAVRRRPHRPTATLAVPSTSVIQHRHNHCSHQALFAAAAAAATKSRAFLGEVHVHVQRNHLTSKKRSRRVLNLFTAQLLGKWNLFRDFQQVQIYSIAHKNQKRITAGTQ
jgi:hypothetical protein